MAIYSNVLFNLNQGETWKGRFFLPDEYGDGVSLAGATSTLLVRVNAGDTGSALITLTYGAGIDFEDPGVLTFETPTDSLPGGSYAVSWRVVLSDGTTQDLWDGTLVITVKANHSSP